MYRIAGRPAGVALLAALIALDGLASLAEALELARSRIYGEPSAVVALLIGILLLYKAHGLWNFRFRAWLMTLLIVTFHALFNVARLLVEPTSGSVWIALGLAAVAIVYLIQPGVRNLFARRSGSP